MQNYTDQELNENYDKFIGAIKKVFKGDRLEKLLFMYSETELGPNLLLSPASGNVDYHNAYEGGYVDHIMNVVSNSLRMKKTFVDAGGTLDFTDEELLFSAFHHDLGKLGDPGKMNYIKNPSDWHVKNQGKIFTSNPDLNFMDLTDRTFHTLQKYGIIVSENEHFGIQLTDGMYDESNVKYLKTFDPTKTLKMTLPRILHWADHMSTVIEYQNR